MSDKSGGEGSAAPTRDESVGRIGKKSDGAARGARARRKCGFASDRSGSAGPSKERLSNGAAALMREASKIGSGARARQERGVRQRSAPVRSCSSLGF